ncbi:CAAX prenyl protease-related protein [Ideonella sp. A 288]|uniref:CAAX prenyl protease-related protein n=1 Tax=Ideonella sp. A 288 TaxID=1962181 RepID=UPI000B4B84FA|nr:CAAX prenyl protease-related protein [Ideonella sp. A 288]
MLNLSPSAWRRVLPFALFMVLLGLRGMVPADGSWGIDARWVYGVSVLAVGGLLLAWRRDYGELGRQNLPGAGELALAVAVGLGVFALWIQLTAPWMLLGEPTATFRPLDANGQPQWPLIAVRFIGAALLVPVMEELFWRSFLMRWIEAPRFEGVDPRRVGLKAIVLSTFVFTLAHPQWLAAVLAGLAYAGLYVRTGRLWTAVIAHAVTNGALGVYVVMSGRWEFW